MSSNHSSDHPGVPAENPDWRRDVDEIQKSLSTHAPSLLALVKPGEETSLKAAIEQGPVIFKRLQELEQLQQSRLNDIDQCLAQWRSAVSDRTGELQALDQRAIESQHETDRLLGVITQQQGEVDRLGREIGILAHQRYDARDKLNADIRASERQRLLTAQEVLRLDNRSAALDTRQQGIEVQGADVARANELLRQEQQTLARKQEEESRKEKENKKKSAEVNIRLDLLAEYRKFKDQEVTKLASQVENLTVENGDLAGTKNDLEGRVLTLQQQVGNLQGTIRDQNTELGNLRGAGAEKDRLNSSVIYLSGVLLPQKQTEINKLDDANQRASASEKELTGKVRELKARILTLEGQLSEQETQLRQQHQEQTSL